MTQEIRELKKMVDKLNLRINKLTKPNPDQQTSIDLYFEIFEMLKRTIVNYCIAELNQETYNLIIVYIELAIRNLKDKDESFNSKFNKREIVRNIIEDYKDETYIIIEPEVSLYINQTNNKELDKHLEISIINFFRSRLSIIQEINNREESLRIINPN